MVEMRCIDKIGYFASNRVRLRADKWNVINVHEKGVIKDLTHLVQIHLRNETHLQLEHFKKQKAQCASPSEK